jgi:hypothetical protein
MSRLALTSLPALILTLASCGSGDPRQAGLRAIQAGEWSKAIELLDEAIADRSTDSPIDVEVAMGRCFALAHIDAARAKTEFDVLVAAGKTRVADYEMLLDHLLAAPDLEPATQVLDAGMHRFPGDPSMEKIKKQLVSETTRRSKGNDPAAERALNSLKSMGYLGGD